MDPVRVLVISDETEIAERLFWGAASPPGGLADAEVIAEADGPVKAEDLFFWSGLCKSRGEARRLVAQGGAYICNRRVEPDGLARGPLLRDRFLLLRKGKRHIAALEFLWP